MTTKIAAWGNSLGIRIPKEILEAIQLEAGDPVDIQCINNKIIIRSAEDESLEEMMKKVKPTNKHSLLLDFDSVGREAW